jgi:hypothetical protein
MYIHTQQIIRYTNPYSIHSLIYTLTTYIHFPPFFPSPPSTSTSASVNIVSCVLQSSLYSPSRSTNS